MRSLKKLQNIFGFGVPNSLPYPLTKNRNLQINKMRFLSLTGEATMTSRPKSQIIDLLKKIARIAKIARIVKIAIYAVPVKSGMLIPFFVILQVKQVGGVGGGQEK